MTSPEIEERFTTVEAALAEYIITTNRSQLRLERALEQLSKEMKEFKDEMKGYKEESRQEFREMKKQWGELANKMGTLVEDIIAPAVRPVMEQYFKEEVTYLAVNVRKKDKAQNLRGEFDVIAASASRVFLIETKSSPKKEQISTFKNEVIPRFRQLFPEYHHLQLTPVFSSLRFEEDLIEVGTQEGIYMMAYREWDYMDLLNFEALAKP
ncbi:MAG: hypothetical protein KIS77_05435 [Saprospiraceae bacterium]|nr:hypothetical protein [Saprospiraceae bacterium]